MPFSTTTLSWLVLLALVLAAVAAVLALSAQRRRGRPARPRRRRLGKQHPPQPLTTSEVTAEIAELQATMATSLRHLAVVRYDAFGDMGGHMSWSMALLDDAGDGVVLTSIHGRSDSRTYAKNVAHWSAGQQLSPEEEEAISFARNAQ